MIGLSLIIALHTAPVVAPKPPPAPWSYMTDRVMDGQKKPLKAEIIPIKEVRWE